MDRAPQDSSSEDGDKLEPDGLDYKEIAREVLARIDERLADLERDHPSPRSEAPFHAQTVSDIMGADRRGGLVRMVGFGFIGLLLSASLVAAASLLWLSRDTGKSQSGAVGAAARCRHKHACRQGTSSAGHITDGRGGRHASSAVASCHTGQ